MAMFVFESLTFMFLFHKIINKSRKVKKEKNSLKIGQQGLSYAGRVIIFFK